jgi:arginine utilization protein RocB
MKNIHKENQLRQLTVDLVSTSSIVNSEGERIMADKIIAILSDFDIFKKHPEWLRICPVIDDQKSSIFDSGFDQKAGNYKNRVGNRSF